MSTKQMPSTVLVPFHREKTGHITVVAKLGGKPVRFLVDTGAGGTCIDLESVDKFKLRLNDKATTGGGVGSNSMKMRTVLAHDLSLQGLDLSGFKLIAVDLSHAISGLVKKKVESFVGVLGADVFYRNRAVIDYARGVLLMSPQTHQR